MAISPGRARAAVLFVAAATVGVAIVPVSASAGVRGQASPRATAALRGPRALPGGAWKPLGPAAIGPAKLLHGLGYGGVNSGRITGLVVIPSGLHPGRIVAGTAGGGIWTSDDNGAHWTPRTDFASSLAIGAVADSASSPNVLIAG